MLQASRFEAARYEYALFPFKFFLKEQANVCISEAVVWTNSYVWDNDL